jgi:hypothetical protein
MMMENISGSHIINFYRKITSSLIILDILMDLAQYVRRPTRFNGESGT